METSYKVFKRKIYDKMLEWKQSRDGATALLIKGARRVGKSTIAEEFARNEYESYIVVDFADAPAAVWEAVDNISDRDSFFMQLQFIYDVTLHERHSVIIFDEIQKCPAVRQAIKYLVKDHRYDYIETGSLLSIKKNTKDIVIPSEETRLTMYPMDYEEFRWALGDTTTLPLLKASFENKRSLGDALTRKLLRDLRLYMLVGGMPQAVEIYLNTNNLAEVDAKKRENIELYNDDISLSGNQCARTERRQRQHGRIATEFGRQSDGQLLPPCRRPQCRDAHARRLQPIQNVHRRHWAIHHIGLLGQSGYRERHLSKTADRQAFS